MIPSRVEPVRTLPPDLAKLKGGEEREFEIAPGVKMAFCWIPPGEATLGSPVTEPRRGSNEPEHEYVCKGFWMGKYSVTQQEYKALMGHNPSWFTPNTEKIKEAGIADTARFPVEQVTWYMCQAFATRMNFAGRRGQGFRRKAGSRCRTRTIGNMPAGAGKGISGRFTGATGRTEPNRIAAQATIPRANRGRTCDGRPKRVPMRRPRRTRGGCATWPATCGTGVRICMVRDPSSMPVAAALGTATPRTAARPTATGRSRRLFNTIWASASRSFPTSLRTNPPSSSAARRRWRSWPSRCRPTSPSTRAARRGVRDRGRCEDGLLLDSSGTATLGSPENEASAPRMNTPPVHPRSRHDNPEVTNSRKSFREVPLPAPVKVWGTAAVTRIADRFPRTIPVTSPCDKNLPRIGPFASGFHGESGFWRLRNCRRLPGGGPRCRPAAGSRLSSC